MDGETRYVPTGRWDPWRRGSFRIPLMVSAKITIVGSPTVFVAGLLKLDRELRNQREPPAEPQDEDQVSGDDE